MGAWASALVTPIQPTPDRRGEAVMKGVDAGVLRGILEGEPGAREFLRRLRGFEVATTERSMLALSVEARASAGKAASARLAALVRLRREVTVLPIDPRTVAEASRHFDRRPDPVELWALAEWAALEANGCDELFTRSKNRPGSRWRFKVTQIAFRKAK